MNLILSKIEFKSAQAGCGGSPVNPDQDVARQHEHRRGTCKRVLGLGAKEQRYPIRPIINSAQAEQSRAGAGGPQATFQSRANGRAEALPNEGPQGQGNVERPSRIVIGRTMTASRGAISPATKFSSGSRAAET